MSRVDVTGSHGYGYGLTILNPRETRTRDKGLTGITGVAVDCYCHITGCFSLIPSVSNHILTSGNHKNEDSEREEQQRWRRQGGIPGAPWFFIIIIALFTDYTKTTEVREAARRVSTPSLFHCHCTTKRRPSQAPATTGDRQQNERKEWQHCEE